MANKEKNFYTIKFKTDTVGVHTLMLKVCNDDGIQDTLLVSFENTPIKIDEIDENGEDGFPTPYLELRTSELNIESFSQTLVPPNLERPTSSTNPNMKKLSGFSPDIRNIIRFEEILIAREFDYPEEIIYTEEITDEFESLIFPNIKFVFDKTVIVKGTDKELVFLIEFLKKHNNVNIEIAGHTDSYGSIEYNQKLSERRAKKVKSLLVEAGIDTKRISTIGYSKNSSLNDNDTDEHRLLNRRVEFRLVR